MPRQTALTHFAQGISELLDKPLSDRHLQALAVMLVEGTPRGYDGLHEGWGALKLYFEDHWVKGVALELTDPLDPASRKPPK
jgi:hypothetical protein